MSDCRNFGKFAISYPQKLYYTLNSLPSALADAYISHGNVATGFRFRSDYSSGSRTNSFYAISWSKRKLNAASFLICQVRA